MLLLGTTAFAQASWKLPEYKPEAYRKVMVLAKFSDELARRQMEDELVALLNTNGIKAIPSYSNVTEADLASEQAFMTRMDSLAVDGLIAYTIKGTDTKYKNTPSVGVSVGIPVRVGMFGGYLGTHVPLAGGAKTEQSVNLNVSFYNRSSKSMQWSLPLSGKLKNETSRLAESFAKTTYKAMKEDKLFLP